jgi:acyl-coenzyme A thioesterase PaaI-like protein
MGKRNGRTPDDGPLAAVRSDHACFGCGAENPIGLRLRFALAGDAVTAAFTPAPEHQGFHDVVHGGIISTVLDEAMAWATAAAGLWTVTGEMQTRFRQPLLVGEATHVTATVTGQRGKIVQTSARLFRDTDGATIATAKGTFVKVPENVAAGWEARYLRDSGAE